MSAGAHARSTLRAPWAWRIVLELRTNAVIKQLPLPALESAMFYGAVQYCTEILSFSVVQRAKSIRWAWTSLRLAF